MPSAALTQWQNDRMHRLSEVDAHGAAVLGLVPPNPTFLDETLRGCVLHLSAHFQGFCRDLYTECSQIWIAAIPVGFRATAQAQFAAHLAIEKGNPTHDNIKRDFNRFGFLLQLQAAHPAGAQQVTDLGHLNDWRNKAAHQGTSPLGGGVPAALTLPIAQEDQIMPTQKLSEPMKVGTVVKIRDSGYPRATIAEYRGPLGPKGTHVYRVLVESKPRRVYIEVLEDQLEVLAEA